VSAGELPLPDVVEQSRNVVDLSLRTTLIGTLSLKVDAKNLLDSPYEMRQGDVIRESYHTGRSYSIGVSWQQ
jgi:hypothetical protein